MLKLEAAIIRKKPGPAVGRRNFASTKSYDIEILGDKISGCSLIEVYKKCLLKLADLDPGFLEGFSAGGSSGRRYIAKHPKSLYLKSPQLAEDYAKLLCAPWYYDTNLGERQIRQRLEFACEVAGIGYGIDLICSFEERSNFQT